MDGALEPHCHHRKIALLIHPALAEPYLLPADIEDEDGVLAVACLVDARPFVREGVVDPHVRPGDRPAVVDDLDAAPVFLRLPARIERQTEIVELD